MAAKSFKLGSLLAFVFVSLTIFSSVLAIPPTNCDIQSLNNVGRVDPSFFRGPFLGLIAASQSVADAFFNTGAFRPAFGPSNVYLAGRLFTMGHIGGRSAVFVRSGSGLVNAAITTQVMLDHFNVTGVLFFGVAGNTNSSLSIGDVTIPRRFAQAGLWDWLRPNARMPENDVASLDIKDYNRPRIGTNLLGRIAYTQEQFYSQQSDEIISIPQRRFWYDVDDHWLELASPLQGTKLERCVDANTCLDEAPEVVIGLRGSTANAFVDNAHYRDFLYQNFGVSSADMESSAVVMTCASSGYPVIVLRGLSNLAGAEEGQNSHAEYQPLAARNVATVVTRLVSYLPTTEHEQS